MVISSILENDLYKFSMSYYYQVHYPNAWGTFTFHDRNNTEYSEEFVVALKEELKNLASLSLQPSEFDWAVKTIHYIPRCFWEWLCYFRFEADKIGVWIDSEQHLHIEVSDLMYKVTFYEIPIKQVLPEEELNLVIQNATTGKEYVYTIALLNPEDKIIQFIPVTFK
ncbi:MAG: hypothetical protein IKD41_03655, partial [Alistipes sp.]|nr:hypothetical protein [Alistipes sp.]